MEDPVQKPEPTVYKAEDLKLAMELVEFKDDTSNSFQPAIAGTPYNITANNTPYVFATTTTGRVQVPESGAGESKTTLSFINSLFANNPCLPLDRGLWPYNGEANSTSREQMGNPPPLTNHMLIAKSADAWRFASAEVKAEYDRLFSIHGPSPVQVRLESGDPFVANVTASGIVRSESTGELIRRVVFMLDLPLSAKKGKSAEELFRDLNEAEGQ